MNAAMNPVLLIEDNPNDVALIQRAFRNARVANPVRVLGDGEQPWPICEAQMSSPTRSAHPLPIMLLDLTLPRTSGLEVLAWVRSQTDLKRLPVVVLTSSRQPADINRAYDPGANSYLVMPGDSASLVEMVKAVDLYWLILNQQPSME